MFENFKMTMSYSYLYIVQYDCHTLGIDHTVQEEAMFSNIIDSADLRRKITDIQIKKREKYHRVNIAEVQRVDVPVCERKK